jgi:hypothetical protein
MKSMTTATMKLMLQVDDLFLNYRTNCFLPVTVLL